MYDHERLTILIDMIVTSLKIIDLFWACAVLYDYCQPYCTSKTKNTFVAFAERLTLCSEQNAESFQPRC